MKNSNSVINISANLFVYGATHAVVDGVCAAVILSILKNQSFDAKVFVSLVILYNVLAFGLQSVFGIITDYLKSPRAVAFLGCVITGLSAIIFLKNPVAAIILAGLGNALFHVGGGSISLNLTPRKATAPGIYVAPGALGLFAGALLGKSGQFSGWLFVLALAVLSLLMFIIKLPAMDYRKEKITKNKINYFDFIFLLVFLSISIRSLVGMVLFFPWRTNIDLLIILTAAVVFGKGLGGILADRFGWSRVGVGSLALSIPFLVFGADIPYLAIIGMFLFNITMPITLVAISNILPGRPGFAFGVTCLALLIGALPAFTGLKSVLGGQWSVIYIILTSIIALYFGLRFYFKNYTQKNSD